MRIAIWHNLPSGGGKRALHDQVQGLTKRGHHVEVWSPSTADHAYLPLRDIVTEHVDPIDVQIGDPSGQSFRAAIHRRKYLRLRKQAMSCHARRSASEIERGTFDVL